MVNNAVRSGPWPVSIEQRLMSPDAADDGGTVRDVAGGTPLDDRLQVLAHPDRRVLLATFRESGVERLPVAALADDVATERADAPTRRELNTALHHVHLPRCDDAGVLEYDADQSLAIYHGDELLERCLDVIDDHSE
jgi:hypothetical protein